MKVGKTGVRRCEHCEKPLPPEHTVLMPEEKVTVHLHAGQCTQRWAVENMIREEAEKAMRKELKAVWDCICPADRERLRKQFI